MLLLKCPKCGQKMKYESSDSLLIKKRKRCVYCGHSFKVTDSIIRKV